MKRTLTAIATLTTLTLATPAGAENLQHISQLLSTKECYRCDLVDAGLVMADLAGAKLGGANLVQANLSRANLSGADLRGANLAGASLNGANLAGADLSGANLTGVDLRDAYLGNANLEGVNLESAYIEGTIGIPATAGTPKLFYKWGVLEMNTGNYQAAIENYQKALTLDTEYAPAYLGRALARYNAGDEAGATKDAQMASILFEKQGAEF